MFTFHDDVIKLRYQCEQFLLTPPKLMLQQLKDCYGWPPMAACPTSSGGTRATSHLGEADDRAAGIEGDRDAADNGIRHAALYGMQSSFPIELSGLAVRSNLR